MLDQLLAEYQDLDLTGDRPPRAKAGRAQKQDKPAATAVDGDDDGDEHSASPKAQQRGPRPGDFTLDDLLAEYDGPAGVGGPVKAQAQAKATTDPLAGREGDFTLDDLLADYDDVSGPAAEGEDKGDARRLVQGVLAGKQQADPRLAQLQGDFTLDDLLSAYDHDHDDDHGSGAQAAAVDKKKAAAGKAQTQSSSAAAANGWEDEWREDMARFGGAPDEREASLEDLVKTYQPPPAEDQSPAPAQGASSKARVREELRHFVQSMVADDLGLTSGGEADEREAMEPLRATRARARRHPPQATATTQHDDGVRAADVVVDDDDADYDDAEEAEDVLRHEAVDDVDIDEQKDDDDELDDDEEKALDKMMAEAEAEEDQDMEWLTRELEAGRTVHPLEFSPLWRAASKNLPPRRTREEWERLGGDDVEPAFVGIERSESELEGVEVTKRFDAVNDNETDEQYMERMIQMEEEAEMRRAEGELTGKKQGTPVRLTKKEKAEAKLATVDPAKAKNARTKLKRKERRRQEHEQHMEKVKRHHKEGGVKLDGSQMFAHGANVPPELMHWFSDPEGLKTKRDAMLAKKCNKLQRMAELRKTREKRIDMPSDPTTAEVEELLGMTRRQKRMASKIQSHLEDVFVEDLGADSALGQLDININEVVMSRDMRIARVYWKGSGNEDAAERLLHARTSMLRGMLAQRAGVRFSPELVFYRESAESMYHEVSRYMDQLQKQEGWDEATIKAELKRIRKEREAAAAGGRTKT